ncbi:DUF6891 domain-containing protein [Caulobacter sp. CCNWLY153]|uniref:DUF6891 domain-containing protein n=1 Tax=Caulobacter sp. CCNWLY153 TaxID=3125794 RepID=UPI0030151E1D
MDFVLGRAKAPAPRKRTTEEVLQDIRSYIGDGVAAGFDPRDEIVESALAVVGDNRIDAAILRDHAERIADEALQVHAAQQAQWTSPTDCDRLDAAFAELDADGVISRQNFWCCGTCGASAIWDEMESAGNANRPYRGYAFYHEQDTESAVGGYGLHLNYGAREQTDEAAVAIGHEIVAHLNRHGLQTDWDGRIERRIAVSLDWKRRRQNTPA